MFDGSNFLVVYQTVNHKGHAQNLEDPAGIYARQVSPAGVVTPGRVTIVEFDDDFEPMYGPGSMMQWTYRDGRALLVVEGRDASANPSGYVPLDYYGIYAIWLDIDPVSGTPNPSLPQFVEGYVKGQSPSVESFRWPAVAVSSNNQFLLAWEDSSIQPLLYTTPGIARAISRPRTTERYMWLSRRLQMGWSSMRNNSRGDEKMSLNASRRLVRPACIAGVSGIGEELRVIDSRSFTTALRRKFAIENSALRLR